MNKTVITSVALSVLAVWALQNFAPTKKLMNGGNRYFG